MSNCYPGGWKDIQNHKRGYVIPYTIVSVLEMAVRPMPATYNFSRGRTKFKSYFPAWRTTFSVLHKNSHVYIYVLLVLFYWSKRQQRFCALVPSTKLLYTSILIYQGVYCCTKVCNLHLDDSFSKSRDNRMHWTRCNLLKWKGIYNNYESFTDQLQPIYFTCNDL